MIQTGIFFVCTIAALLADATRAGASLHRFLVVAGVNDGGPERVRLRYAVSDARNFASVLHSMGGVAEEDLLLLDEPSASEFTSQLSILRSRVEAADDTGRTEVVLYYSGHADEKGLLLGGDHLSYHSLRQQMDAIPADVRITVLDACASGAITRLKGGQRRQAFLIDESIDTQGYAFLTSSSEDETAQESDRIAASFFTHYLVSGMRGAADRSGDGKVTLGEAYQFAFDETLAQTTGTRGGAQHPSYDINLSGTGDVIMTDVRQTTSGLVLGEDLNGRFFVRNERRQLVAELYKPAGTEVELGLESGTYQVHYERVEHLQLAELSLADGERKALKNADFTSLAREPTALRGGDSPGSGISVEYGEQADIGLPADYKVSLGFLWNHQRDDFDGMQLSLLNHAGGRAGSQIAPLGNLSGGDVRALQLGFIANVAGGYVGQAQLAGVTNISAGPVHGIQAAGVGNISKGAGSQFAGVGNISVGKVQGVQIAGVSNVAEAASSQFAGVGNISAGEVHGIQASGVGNVARGVGSQFAGVGNISAGHARGLQAAGVGNFAQGAMGQFAGIGNVSAGEVQGVQIAGIGNASRTSRGQVAGVANFAERVDFLQFSGVVNAALEVPGLQAGVVNLGYDVGWQVGLVTVSHSVSGFSLGLVNYSHAGRLDMNTWIDGTGISWLTASSGSRHLYSTYSLGIDSFGDGETLLGLGIGAPFRIGQQPFEVDVNIYDSLRGRNRNDNTLGRLRLLALREQAGTGLAVFGGASFDYLWTGKDTRLFPASLVSLKTRDDYTLGLGLFAGLRYGRGT